VREAVYQGPGLASSGASGYEERARAVVHGGALLGIQLVVQRHRGKLRDGSRACGIEARFV
jgi:hypothetical protein